MIFGTVARGVGEQHLGAVPDDAAALLVDAGQEARHVDEGHQRNVEGVAEADEARALVGGIDVEAAGLLHRVVGDDADDDALRCGRSRRSGCLAKLGVDLEQFAVVDQAADDRVHVHRLGDRPTGPARSFLRPARSRSSAVRLVRRILGVVARAGRRAAAGRARWRGGRRRRAMWTLPLTAACISAPPTSSIVTSAAGHRLDHLRAGDEHLRVLPRHDDEVHQRRRVGRRRRRTDRR